MADDYSINAKITADSSGFTSEINKAKNSTNSLGKEVKGSTKGITSNIGNIIKSAGKVAGIVGGITVAFKGVSKVMKETSEAYKVQAKAEIQLATAVNNNPLVKGEATERLKEFASEMQNVSTTGDEVMLPMLAKLISTGRTEEEAMQIMKASLDLSASGMMSLDSAVTQLNATYSGNIGLMGRQIGELKGLTEEELKSGKAIEIVSKKFAGMSEEVAKTTGTSEQLSNAWGDLKEQIGEPIETGILAPFRRGLTSLINTTIDGIKKLKKAVEEAKNEGEVSVAIQSGSATDTQIIAGYDRERKRLEDLRDTYKEVLENASAYSVEEQKQARNAVQSYTVQIAKLDDKYRVAQNNLKVQEDETAELEKQNAILEKRKQLDEEVGKIKKDSIKAIEEQNAKWKAQEMVTGKLIPIEEKLEFYQNNLIDTIAKAKDGISEQNEFYKEQMAIIEELKKKLTKSASQEQYEADIEAFRQAENRKTEILLNEIEKRKREQKEKEDADPFANYKSSLADLSREMGNLFDNLGSVSEMGFGEAMVYLNDYKDELSGVFSGFTQSAKQAFSSLGDMSLMEFAKLEGQINDAGAQVGVAFAYGVSKAVNSIKKIGESLKKIIKIAKDVATKITSVFRTAFSFFEKAIDFSIDGGLDTLLKFEDSILSFFVETLPQLPSFLATAISSLFVLFDELRQYMEAIDITGIIADIVQQILDALPTFLTNIVDAVLLLAQGVIDGLFNWIENDGLTNMLNSVLDCIKKIFQFVSKNADKVATILVDMIVDSIDWIANNIGDIVSVVLSASLKVVGAVATKLVPEIPGILINTIKTAGNIFVSVAQELWNAIKAGVKSLGKGISKAWDWLGSTTGWWATGANNVPSGLAIVGEQGPELVDLHGGERIYNAKNTQAILSSAGSGGNSFNVTFNNLQDTSAYTMMRELKAYNRQMAINGIL